MTHRHREDAARGDDVRERMDALEDAEPIEPSDEEISEGWT
jgi:hypothetical protein